MTALWLLICFIVSISLFHFCDCVGTFVNSDEKCRRQVIQACGKVSKFFFVNGSIVWRDGLVGNLERGCDGYRSADEITPWANASCRDAFPELFATGATKESVVVSEIGVARLGNWCSTLMCSFEINRPVFLCHYAGSVVDTCCVEPGQVPRTNYTSRNQACNSVAIQTVTNGMVTKGDSTGSKVITTRVDSTKAASTSTTSLSTSTSTTSSTSKTSTSVVSTAKTNAAPASDALRDPPALSQDALIGLIVGVILAVLLIIGVIVAVAMRRNRRENQPQAQSPAQSNVNVRSSKYAVAPSISSSGYGLAPANSEYDAASSAFVR